MIWRDKEVLHLVLERRWFLEIANGFKTTEFRDDTPYWEKRLDGKDIEWIYFQYAYFKPSTFMVVECTSKRRRNGRWELGLGKIVELENNHLSGMIDEKRIFKGL